MRLVQEELSVAERRFGVLINSYDDCLDVVVAPTTCSDHPAHHQTFSTPGEPEVPSKVAKTDSSYKAPENPETKWYYR
jgi:hypothetical protein